jgi:DNA replication protein DnaC
MEVQMEHTYHISENLKRLRLPGMLNSLELRVKEAGDNNLGYAEFLSLLLQDELISRESNNLAKRLKDAGFGMEKTLMLIFSFLMILLSVNSIKKKLSVSMPLQMKGLAGNRC